ncbi:hypothetical protein FQN50_000550 [Emmonsiellopsis sp. PD_5]|nr:hypothetical protein FQN50_000550 [Emmonsiellopsis sp. PD_5]
MPALKLYYFPGACSLAPHILLNDLKLNHEVINIKDPSFTADYGAINPKRLIPALAIDSEIITEGPAVSTAIAQLGPASQHLLGKTPLETARVYEWLNYLSGTLHGRGYGGLWRSERYSDDESAREGIKAKALLNIKESYAFVESQLKGLHAVGEQFTIVDPYMLVFYIWGKKVGVEIEKDYPKYTALVKHLLERESVRKTLEEEGLAEAVYGAKV